MKKWIALLLVLALAVSLLSGCSLVPLALLGLGELLPELETEETTSPTPTVPTETIPPVTVAPADGELLRLRNGGWRDYPIDSNTGYIDMVQLGAMPYEHPDVDAICDAFTALAGMAERGEDADVILEKYYDAYDAYMNFYTMDNLAYIRYTLNTNDSYYKEEYDALELESADLEKALEEFEIACADSPSRRALEDAYFGEDYFADFEDYSRYTNEAYLALTKEEDNLLSEYRSALEDPQIEFEGQTQSFNDLYEKYKDFTTYQDYRNYLSVLKAYYNKYNPIIADIYIRLIKIRQKIATEMGYDSYADYSYEIDYARDYTHADGEKFLEEIRQELVPVSDALYGSSQAQSLDHFSMRTDALTGGLQRAVKKMDPEFEEAFNFMVTYDLYDVDYKPEKFDSSYTIYLYDYEAPFLTVNSGGSSRDYVTLSHEFGHFLDYYLTYGAAEDLETAETFSQSMEFLSLCYTDGLFTEQQRSDLLRLNLMETMDTFTYQAALATFEDRVYSLPEQDLTVENINRIFHETTAEFGASSIDYDFYYYKGWIEVTHFFEAPYYVISYCVSAGTAVQVYLREAEEPGAGLAVYKKLLEREAGDGVQTVMTTAGLDNPLRESAVREIAAFYKETFRLS